MVIFGREEEDGQKLPEEGKEPLKKVAKKSSKKPAKKTAKLGRGKATFKRGRKKDFSVKQSTILKSLRTEIIKGFYPPGERLPTRDDMERRFKASRVTIQRAFHDLIREGFVQPKGRNGTFVSSTPPHLYTFAMIFPPETHLRQNNDAFIRALYKEAHWRSMEGPQNVLYFGQIRSMKDYRLYEALFQSLKVKQYAGLILVNGLNPLSESIVEEHSSYAKVSLTNKTSTATKPAIELDKGAFFQRAFERFDGLNRSRIALICGGEDWSAEMVLFEKTCKDYKFHTEEGWIYHVAEQTRGVLTGVLQFMLGGSPDTRPDAILVMDESLVDEILRILDGLGIRPGVDIAIVTQTYFPWTLTKSQAIHRLGYDIRAAMSNCYSHINQQVNKMPTQPRIRLLPEFEDVRQQELKGVRAAKKRTRSLPSTKR